MTTHSWEIKEENEGKHDAIHLSIGPHVDDTGHVEVGSQNHWSRHEQDASELKQV